MVDFGCPKTVGNDARARARTPFVCAFFRRRLSECAICDSYFSSAARNVCNLKQYTESV